MDGTRDRIRKLEGKVLSGELTAEEFEEARDRILAGDDPPVTAGADDDDFGDLEIEAGPAPDDDDPAPARSEEPEHSPRAATPPPQDAFDDNEPTDPESARRRDEIDDLTLSLVLDTQSEIEIDPELMLADDLENVEEEDELSGLDQDRPSSERTSRWPVMIQASRLVRGLLVLAAGVSLLIVAAGALFSAMGPDGFACMVSERVDTVGVWRMYQERFPMGACADRAAQVLNSAGAHEGHASGDHSTHHGEHHDGEHGGALLRGGPLHPLEDPDERRDYLGPAQIVEAPPPVVVPVPSEDSTEDPGDGSDPAADEDGSQGAELSESDKADRKYCSEAKAVNSLDGWRDYLEHFPYGGCSERARHFINVRAPTREPEEDGVLEQRATSVGPSDFVIDTIVLNNASVRRCVRVERARGREVPLQMKIQFTILSDGSVPTARLISEELMDTSLDRCISSQVERLQFPPWDGDDRRITYTLDLRRKATRPRTRPTPVEDIPEDEHEHGHEHEEEEEHGPAEDHGGDGGH